MYFENNDDIFQIISSLNENGAVVIKNLFTRNFVDDLNHKLDKMEPNAFQPFFNLPWGYGNLIKDNLFINLVKNIVIKKSIQTYFNEKEYTINHLVVNEKSSLVGFDVEWHQEVFNMKTYAPGCNGKDHSKKFLQIFIALDDQVADSGGLGVYLKSHLLGILDYIDIISPSLTHKRHVSYDDMKKLANKCELVYPVLNQGDCLIFTNLTVHGSSKNFSLKRRRSVVIQAQSKNTPDFDKKIYLNEVKYRHNLVIEKLSEQIRKLAAGNLYSDLSKSK